MKTIPKPHTFELLNKVLGRSPEEVIAMFPPLSFTVKEGGSPPTLQINKDRKLYLVDAYGKKEVGKYSKTDKKFIALTIA